MVSVDLHVHTEYSDGSFSPEYVLSLAKKRNLKAIAITDHDVITAVKDSITIGKKLGIEVIPGIEFSAEVNCSKDTIHLLGYFFNPDNKDIDLFSKKTDKEKANSTRHRLEIANKKFRCNISYLEVAAKTKGVPSQPHIAMVLFDKGIVKSVAEGIKFFSKGGPGYVKGYKKIPAKKAIQMLHKAGGIAVLAHPFAYKKENKFTTKESVQKLIHELIDYGLDGIEVIAPNVTKEEKARALKICNKNNLIATGGSDFHNEQYLPENVLGGLAINYSVVSAIKRRLKEPNLQYSKI